MAELVDWVEKHSALTQALATIVLVLVTIFYAWFTRKLMHTGHHSQLEPKSIQHKNGRWIVELTNHGPGIAKDIVLKKLGIFPAHKGTLQEMQLVDSIQRHAPVAEGRSTLGAQESHEYRFQTSKMLNPSEPFRLTWRTVTGKRYRDFWKFESMDAGPLQPRRIEVLATAKYYSKRLIFISWSLVVRMLVWRRRP